MDREDRRRFFVIGSVFLEVVTPVFRRQLENNYIKSGFSRLQDFLNNQPIVHTLFHLNHRYAWCCCVDSQNCTSRQKLPLYNYQWNLLYTENPGPGKHHCHCKYTAKPVQLDDLDITLIGLILVNCFTLRPAEEQAVRSLRQYKNDYLSHNTNCGIPEPKYNSLLPDLTYHVLQLDPNIQSELEDRKNRPLDEQLCQQYYIHLLDVTKRFEEIGDSLKGMNTAVQGIRTDVHGMNTSFQAIGWNIHGMDESVQRLNITLKDIEGTVHGGNTTLQALERSIQGGNTTLQEINTALQGIPLMNDTLQKLLYYVERVPCTCQRQNPDIQRQERQSYHLGQDIFHLQHQFDKSSPSYDMNFPVNKAVITNDGYVASIDTEESLMNIYKTDGSYVTAIRADGLDFTAVNNSMVAVTRFFCNRIDIWDIHNEQKVKVKSIQLLPKCYGITTMNNKLVVGCEGRLLMIDPQTEKVEKTFDIAYSTSDRLCGSSDGIFYTDMYCPYLYHHSLISNKNSKLKLPSTPLDITILQDGSVYVICQDGSVLHASSDGKKYTNVTTKELASLKFTTGINYNPVHKKLVVTTSETIAVFQCM